MFGTIVVARRDDDLLRRGSTARHPVAIVVSDDECAVLAGDGQHRLVLMNVELVVIGDAAVVLQRLRAIRLFVQAASSGCRRSPATPAW